MKTPTQLKSQLKEFNEMITEGRTLIGSFDPSRELNELVDLCNDLAWACAFAMGTADALSVAEPEELKAP